MSESKAKKRVLVIDDELTVLDISKKMLEFSGFVVEVADSGANGVETFSQDPAFDLVILDLTMPDMDGAATFRELIQIDRTVKVVVASGYQENEALSQFEPKPVGFLQKPFRMQTLIETVKQYVE